MPAHEVPHDAPLPHIAELTFENAVESVVCGRLPPTASGKVEQSFIDTDREQRFLIVIELGPGENTGLMQRTGDHGGAAAMHSYYEQGTGTVG